MQFKILGLFILLLIFNTSFATEKDLYAFNNTTDSDRFTMLTKEIRCVVCQNQNIADSNAPLAKDLREKIYFLIKENNSDVQIKDYLVKRYGDFILLRPRFALNTLLLWLFPALAVVFAGGLLFKIRNMLR